MFLVELMPGKARSYRTRAELVAAIWSGEITAGSRIFHRATSRWISITEHPEYRRFQAEPHAPPYSDPPMPPEAVAPTAARKPRGFFHRLAGVVAALRRTGARAEFHLSARAKSGWASLKRHFGFGGTRTARSSKPPKSANPVPSAQPGQPDQQIEPRDSDPARERWTFYP